MKKNHNKKIAIFTITLMCMIGTYNAVMINSESSLSDSHNLRRLDDIFGSVKSGRTLAVTTDWKKVTPSSIKMNVAASDSASASSNNVVDVAAIQDSLALKLVEVVNPQKWENGVAAADFSGSISTSHGIIESLNASLPGGVNIEIAFSEMSGNTFEYDLNGEVFTGMMYQVDQSAYMITMTNGPLEGTRMRFTGETPADAPDYLAETHNVEVQNFGEESDAPVMEATETVPAQTAEAASFNFNI